MVQRKLKKGKHEKPPPPKSSRVTRSQRRAMERSLSNTGHEDLNTQLKNLGLCTKNITGDGNCLFRALSDQYYGTDTHHRTIRQQICHFLKQNEETYKFFVEDDQSFEHHVECMGQDATFGGNMELAAFAKMRAVDIKVYQPGMIYIINGREEGEGTVVEEENEEEEEQVEAEENDNEEPTSQVLHIAYHSWEHYSSVRNIDGPYSGPPEVKVTKVGNGHVNNHTTNDTAEEDEDEQVELFDSKEKMVLNACPGTNIRKVRRLLKRYHGDVNKVIDKLYEEVQVVIESLDTAIIHPLETSQIGGSVPVESVKNHNMEDQQQEDSDALKIDQEVTEDNMNEDDKEDKGDKDYSPENGTDEEQEEPEKKKQDKEPAEKKQKKPSASERKKEAKRKQKEAKLQKEREKAARKAKYKQEAVTAESNTEHDKPVTTTHSMKEMYI